MAFILFLQWRRKMIEWESHVTWQHKCYAPRLQKNYTSSISLYSVCLVVRIKVEVLACYWFNKHVIWRIWMIGLLDIWSSSDHELYTCLNKCHKYSNLHTHVSRKRNKQKWKEKIILIFFLLNTNNNHHLCPHILSPPLMKTFVSCCLIC